MTSAGARRGGGIPGLRTFSTRDFRLVSGQVLPELTVAYETYGALDADRANAILVMHGTTSTHVAAGRVTHLRSDPAMFIDLGAALFQLESRVSMHCR